MKKIRVLFVQAVLLLALASSGALLASLQDAAAVRADVLQPLAPLTGGGPDAAGYIYLDSNEPGGPVYAWEEIAATGTLATNWHNGYDDGYAGPFPIGFSFPYYDNVYTEFYIGTNGYLSFGHSYWDVPWDWPPDSNYPNNDILLFGDDLFLSDYGNDTAIYYQALSSPARLVVEFVNLYDCCTGSIPHTFEVILYASGEIRSQYRALNGATGPYVGIENQDGTIGLGYSTGLSDNLAILYSPPLGVFLQPPGQAESGGWGETIQYILELKNWTRGAESFNLSLGAHDWYTWLSTTSVGPLQPGEAVTFTVSVMVPQNVEWYASESMTVTAASLSDPLQYFDTAALTTTAYAPAQISASPSALSSTQYMDEVVTQTLYVGDSAGITLTYEIAEGGLHTEPHILAWTTYADDASYDHILEAIGQHISYTLEELDDGAYPAPETVAAALAGKDVFLVPPAGYGSYGLIYNNGVILSEVLDRFVSARGLVIAVDFCRGAADLLSGSGLMDVDWLECYGGRQTLEIVRPDHPYARGVSPVFPAEIGTGGFSASNALEIVRWQDSQESAAAVRQVGYGQAGLLGFDFWQYNADMARLLVNAVSQNLERDIPWLSENPTGGSVFTYGSSLVEIAFDTTGMQPGVYTDVLFVADDEALNSPLGLPVTVTAHPAHLGPGERRAERCLERPPADSHGGIGRRLHPARRPGL